METKSPARPWGALIGALVLVALVAVWATQGTLAGSGLPIGRTATIAVGMTLQAIPFLLLGVFVAELIEAFISPALIARVFPTNPVASVLTALVAAFLLPVCDCSAVPIFRSLLRKGVPLSAATTLMLASPAINPLVIASPYYAFGSWAIVGARIGLSIVVALSVG
ncbi:MAG: permease, partial [Thermobifida sp.]|nr:permease [Thermobifida sp.]